MCVLSIYRLKWLISIGIIITLAIGITLLYVLVYSFVISSITAQVQTTSRNILIVLFLSTALLMILSSLSGIYGTFDTNYRTHSPQEQVCSALCDYSRGLHAVISSSGHTYIKLPPIHIISVPVIQRLSIPADHNTCKKDAMQE